MPSRTLPSPAPVNSPFSSSVASHHDRTTTRIVPPLAAVGFSLFITLSICFCKFNRKRRSPAAVTSSSSPPQKPPLHEFSYSSLRKATSSFSPENRLGQGGFGSVFRGTLSPSSGGNVAVKVMDSGSLQGEREFQNELFFAGKLDSPHVVSVIGFSRRRSRLILVYELMDNGNLQDALLLRKSPELMIWNRRFLVAIDIAKGIEYLHSLNLPVIHGDLKPSNILLDRFFSAKISDFGLARLKSEHVEVKVASESDEVNVVEDYGSVVEEVESVVTNTTGYDESNFGFTDQSPVPLSSPEMVAQAPMASPETVVSVSPEMGEKVSVEKKKSSKKLECCFSLDEEKEKGKKKKNRRMVRDWWKDEYRKELAKRMKKKKKKKTLESEFYSDDVSGSVDQRRRGDEELYRKKRRGGSSNSIGSSIDWWLDGLSGEQWRARRRNSQDSVKSCGVSSTPSMRGTMCYVAPECCGNNIDDVSEKSDVYSYGVLLLVLVSGRRPLEVTGPASEIMLRANLMSWARKLARRGRLGDLIDEKLQLLDKEQAVLCIKVALQCLQKSPVSRPSMKDVLEMLTGAMSPPDLPTEFSPSPQTRFSFKTRRKHNR
ncbi:receptor-like serine/threonine-protein kinase At4g25390 [Arabidopsis lyrata subsp. lyrata]|uniref:receptor-like serine/threonine-protein kinase At4g25390 n=1 Tax=Arabidopsis lyrata subsp. lyrata TaxID=81972 RepID=UPI000A29DEE1|nr:receptor-like serine/threonine-protein kinase At4g25390 [Arabidopsis lyrata subsp. lyrata]|eukprot:XP_020871432.1 receptor-like serine/threonine-protein kinase At4g25390 [Arabidopsis lyrata subsp. lyrata]